MSGSYTAITTGRAIRGRSHRTFNAGGADPPGAGYKAAAHQDFFGRSRRESARRRSAGPGFCALGSNFRKSRAVRCFGASTDGVGSARRARSPKRQRRHQEPIRRRRARSGAIFGAWPAVGVTLHVIGVCFTLGANCNLEAVACAHEAIRYWRDHT